MKKVLLFFVGLFVFQTGWSQEIVISSFEYDSTDVSAQDKPVHDLNDEICALVVLRTQGVDGIEIKGSVVTQSYRQNTHYLYLPNRTKRITIYHQNYIPLTINFNELFNTTIGLKGGKTYYITIKGSGSEVPVQNRPTYSNCSNYLSIESTIPLTRLVVNGQEWHLQNGKAIQKMVQCGEYTYSASANGYYDVSGTITVTKSIDPVVVSVQFEK